MSRPTVLIHARMALLEVLCACLEGIGLDVRATGDVGGLFGDLIRLDPEVVLTPVRAAGGGGLLTPAIAARVPASRQLLLVRSSGA